MSIVPDSVVHDGKRFPVHPHTFWYLAPSRVDYLPSEPGVRPLDFALLLHNAIIGRGVVVPMDVLLQDLPASTNRAGVTHEVEMTLERVRCLEYPQLPSRLRCHFLNYDRDVAEFRQQAMFRMQRRLCRCHLVGGGSIHTADVDIFDRLQGRPDDEALARRYWHPFLPSSEAERFRLEVLTSSALYFPDWESFPRLRDDALLAWQRDRGVCAP